MADTGFQKAVRRQAKLRLSIGGPSGSGKTMAALSIAKGIGGRIAVLDTERGSASLYASDVTISGGRVWKPPAFDTMELSPPFRPETFVKGIRQAQSAGYDILIIDSITHEWSGTGGCLEMVDEYKKTRCNGNQWAAWGIVTPLHQQFVDSIIQSTLHIIATVRSKTETDQITNAAGKKEVVKLGMKNEQREGMEYEFTTHLELIHAGHYATSGKDRTGLFSGDPQPISEATGQRLAMWLNSGAAPVEPPVVTQPVSAPMPPPNPVVDRVKVPETPFDSATIALMAVKSLEELQAMACRIGESKKLTNDEKDELMAFAEKVKADRGL